MLGPGSLCMLCLIDRDNYKKIIQSFYDKTPSVLTKLLTSVRLSLIFVDRISWCFLFLGEGKFLSFLLNAKRIHHHIQSSYSSLFPHISRVFFLLVIVKSSVMLRPGYPNFFNLYKLLMILSFLFTFCKVTFIGRFLNRFSCLIPKPGSHTPILSIDKKFLKFQAKSKQQSTRNL